MSGTVGRYGLIGKPLGHSLSPFIHERIMEAVGIKGVYKLYELDQEDLSRELPRLLRELDGFNCTIPYKQSVIPYLQGLAPSAELYGAVNTVHAGLGHNTDGLGFRSCRVPLAKKRVCILGAGGVARVLAWEAARAGAEEIVICSRRPEQGLELAEAVQAGGFARISWAPFNSEGSWDVFLNGTPLGMWPDVGGLPVQARQLQGAQVVFDTIYNPTATRLLLKAKAQGMWAQSGLRMLVEQAVAAQQIWNPERDFSQLEGELTRIERDLAWEVFRRSSLKLILSGFMGAGKTHVGRMLAGRLGVPFVDLDEVITARARMSVPEIFAQRGEEGFRLLERECLGEELRRPGAVVLAAGGGAVIQEGAENLIRDLGGLIIYLDVPLETALARCASGQERPLLSSGHKAAADLYHRRRPLYEAAADFRVDAGLQDTQIVQAILQALALEV